MDSRLHSGSGAREHESITPEAAAMGRACRPMAEGLLLRAYELDLEVMRLRDENDRLRAELAGLEHDR